MATPRVVRSTSPSSVPDIRHRLRSLSRVDLQLAYRRAGHRRRGRRGRRDLLLQMHVIMGPTGGGFLEVDVVRSRWVVALGLDEARLQIDDVVAQLVVLGLDCLVVFVQEIVVADLLLEFLDMTLFALAEGSLCGLTSQVLVSWVVFVIHTSQKAGK